MPKSPPSGRAYKHVSLSCGLLNVPVDIYSGVVSDHGVKRNQFVTVTKDDGTTEDHPVGNKNYDKETGKDVEYEQIIKKIATEYGPVYVEDHEIEQLFELAPDVIEIREFQPQALFYQGHYVPRSLYYVEPQKALKGKTKVPSPANQQALALLLEAMKDEGVIAICDFVTRGKPIPAVLLPNGTLWAVYHTDALREQRPLPEIELPPEVIAQGRMLIQMLLKTEPLDLSDERSALIQNFADEKAAAGDFGKPEAPTEETKAPVATNDLMKMLAASVEVAKQKREVV